MTTFDEPDGVQGWESDSRKVLENLLGPKCAKSGLFEKARVSVRVRVRVSFSRCEMTTFDEPDGVQGWEGDSTKFFKTFWAQSVQKVDCLKKLGLALGLGSGLAFQGVKRPLSTNQMVSKVGEVNQE